MQLCTERKRRAYCSQSILLVSLYNHHQPIINLYSSLDKVLKEALEDNSVGMIVSYHPPIFRPLKCITMADYKQSIVLRCIANGISVYSPHTALDACEGGINDWLAEGVGQGTLTPIVPSPKVPSSRYGIDDNFTKVSTGMGRLLRLDKPMKLEQIIQNVKSHLGLSYGMFEFLRNFK